MLWAYMIQTEATYIGHRQETVAQWVALRLIFKVCAREQEVEVGGERRRPWWRQEALEEVIRAPLVEALREAWMRR